MNWSWWIGPWGGSKDGLQRKPLPKTLVLSPQGTFLLELPQFFDFQTTKERKSILNFWLLVHSLTEKCLKHYFTQRLRSNIDENSNKIGISPFDKTHHNNPT